MASTSVAKQSSATKKKFPNWLEMPDELMANILQRLRTAEKLKSARKVCTTWRRVCKDPAMWKVIDLYKFLDDRKAKDSGMETLTKQAVHLSCGESIDISITGFGNDDLLDYISLRSSKLKRLCLVNCNEITGSGLVRAVKRAPQLEELHVSDISLNAKDVEVIGRNCPQLKLFKMCKQTMVGPINRNDNALAIAKYMPELCHLDVIDSEMTNDGLKAILNGCLHLESLDVEMCRDLDLDLDWDLGNLCRERIKDFKCYSSGYEWYDYQLCDCGCDFDVHDSPRELDPNMDFDDYNDLYGGYW